MEFLKLQILNYCKNISKKAESLNRLSVIPKNSDNLPHKPLEFNNGDRKVKKSLSFSLKLF